MSCRRRDAESFGELIGSSFNYGVGHWQLPFQLDKSRRCTYTSIQSADTIVLGYMCKCSKHALWAIRCAGLQADLSLSESAFDQNGNGGKLIVP